MTVAYAHEVDSTDGVAFLSDMTALKSFAAQNAANNTPNPATTPKSVGTMIDGTKYAAVKQADGTYLITLPAGFAKTSIKLDTGVLTSIEYTLTNAAETYVQNFPDGGLKFADIEKTDTTNTGGSSGVGCNAGLGAGLLCGAALCYAVRRRR
ncbi:hypothetical protein LJC31_01365 [Synergistaceae bacterium OttesenSCG-928-I11]|nr:hypothetical protein [Synergistaceae bacterium OttesenSCG-928-I11]